MLPQGIQVGSMGCGAQECSSWFQGNQTSGDLDHDCRDITWFTVRNKRHDRTDSLQCVCGQCFEEIVARGELVENGGPTDSSRRGNCLQCGIGTLGQMSLTVYIGESALMSFVFSAYGLGYFGQWGAFPVVLAGIACWAVLTAFAWLWMRSFKQGPLEFVMAAMTGKKGTA